MPLKANAMKHFVQRLSRLSGSLPPLNLVLAYYLTDYDQDPKYRQFLGGGSSEGNDCEVASG